MKRLSNFQKCKLLVCLLLLFASPSQIAIENLTVKSSIFDYYLQTTGTLIIVTTAIPLLTVLSCFDLLSNLVGAYYPLEAIRRGSNSQTFRPYLGLGVRLSAIFALALFVGSLVIGWLHGYRIAFSVSHPLFNTGMLAVMTRLGITFLNFLAIILFVWLVELIWRKTAVTFFAGMVFWVASLLSIRSRLFFLLKSFPLMTGDELYFPFYPYLKFPLVTMYLSLFWVLVELVLLNVVVKKWNKR